MARQIVGNPFENQIPNTSPTARVVDTYVQPVKKNDFEQLTQMLNRLDPKIKRNEANNQEREDKTAYAEGARLYQENRVAMGKAVKEGLIPEGASPYLRKGYRESQMNTLAMRYTGELEAALASENLHHNDDPNVVNKFISDFQSDFVEANGMSKFSDAEMATNFGTSASKAEELFRKSWQNKHIEWQKEQNYIQLGNEVYEAVSTMLSNDMGEVEYLTNRGMFGVWLEETAAKYSTNGANNATVLNTIIDAVGIHVEETGDLEVLEVFKDTRFGTDVVGNSLSFKKKEGAIISSTIRLENARIAKSEKELDKKHEEQRAQSARYLIEFLTDPSPLTRKQLEFAIASLKMTGEEKNATLAVSYTNHLLAGQKADQMGGMNITAQSEISLDARLREAKTYQEATQIILEFANDGKIKVPSVAAKLNVWKQQYDPALDSAVGLDFGDSGNEETMMMNNIYSMVKKNDLDYTNATISRAIDAKYQFKQSMRTRVAEFQTTNNRLPTEGEKQQIAYVIFKVMQAQLIKSGVLEAEEE